MHNVKAWLNKIAQPIQAAQDPESNKEPAHAHVQWMTSDNENFFPASKNIKKLTPGFYEIRSSMAGGMFFGKVDMATEDIIKFPETESDSVVQEIDKFWAEEQKFRESKLAYKRGILLYGPPGSGKTCTIKMILEDVIKRGGVAVKFDDPYAFTAGMKILRDIQPETPVVALMEDLDSILSYNSESRVINVIDGVDGIDKVVFLATTNYPEKLGSRIMNRPSRFDRRFFIGMPNAQSRRIYLENKLKGKDQDIGKWVDDTENLSIAHLKELVVAVTILENKYDDAIEILKGMSKKIDSSTWDTLGDGEALAKAIMEVKLAKKKTREKDRIPGGLADDRDVSEFDPEQLGKGMQVEKEHADDPGLALEIAKDHLSEFPKYYDALDEMEKGLKKKKASRWGSGWNSELLPGMVFASRKEMEGALERLS
jgi:SpoVK/Ycf46/Vps4 family AAA+-type ATPase